MVAFFSESTKRTKALDSIVKKRLPRVVTTRWNYNGRLGLTIFKYHESLIELFEDVTENISIFYLIFFHKYFRFQISI